MLPERPRFLPLFAFFLATGLLAFAYLQKTVYRGAGEKLSPHDGAIATRAIVTHWMRDGYFATHGLLNAVPGETRLYRWSSGAYFATSLIVERLWIGVTGRYSWRLLALHNVFVALVVSALFGVLAFRFARRLGLEQLHAAALAAGAQMVQFTFPDNVALYWQNRPHVWWLLFALCFFLAEEEGRPLMQALAVFAMTYMEFIYATFFLAAYAATVLLLRDERPPLRPLAKLLAVPWAAAMALFALQRLGIHDLAGSAFLYRTGLDGDAALYRTHLDIAFGRAIVRRQQTYLFHWPVLFVCGAAAALASFGAYLRGRAPRAIAVPLFSLLGAYVLYAAVFSQHVAMHPYLFDTMLATPLIAALFVVVPALAEAATEHRGVFVLIAAIAAAWTSMVNLRLYALSYPA